VSKIATVKKQPNEKRRYGIDYSNALDANDEIISATALSSPVGLTVGIGLYPEYINVICEGGADGVTYKVTLTVTTTESHEIIEDELYVKVKEI